MERELRADGDVWTVRLGSDRPGPETRAILFFPRTTTQRPYRVVEVPEDRVAGGEEDLAALSEEELMELFRASRSMDFPKEYA